MCVEVEIINLTNTWKPVDEANLRAAKNSCQFRYPDAPCLTKFTKLDERSYFAMCGKEINKKSEKKLDK